MAKKQTAGRDKLGKLAPKFAQLNDDVLFGEVWSREEQLSPRDRSMITIAALFSAGQYPQLKSHLALGKEHGITKEEAVEIVTQLAFYCGWPKAWSTFGLIQEVYGEKLAFVFQGAAPEAWMLEKAEYTISRFARMYGMEYTGMASSEKEAKTLSKKL